MASGTGTLRSAVLAFVAVLAIMYVVPFPVYGLLSAAGWVEMPDEGSPGEFMLAVLVIKVGVAFGFVALLRAAFGVFGERWLSYAAIWWMMYAIVEFGQAIGPYYSLPEALGGVISEAIYFPLSSLAAVRLLGGRKVAA